MNTKKFELTFNKKIVFGIVSVILLMVVIVIGSLIGQACSILGKIDYLDENELAIPENLDSIEIEAEQDIIESGSDILDESQMAEIDANNQSILVGEDGLKSKDGVTNILVLGVDSRSKKNLKSRSDVIIIATINENTNEITLSSIMRDIYVAIPGRSSSDKINAACAYGGPALAVKTVEQNFGIKIDNFVVFNFYSFMDIVDALGGITVDISSGEKKWINTYIEEINRKQGWSINSGKLNKTGKNITLTGKQAMGYVRVRYAGNGDYERTERQREALEQLIKKAIESDYDTLMDVVDSVASNMSTDMTSSEIIKYVSNAAKFIGYDIKQSRIPVNGSYKGGNYKGQWVLRIDFDQNKNVLHEAIFGE